jgi:lipoprotein-anchoring transpeptidase ErfK/SrfK
VTARACIVVAVAAALTATSSAAPRAPNPDRHVTQWTYVLGPVTARAAPSASAKAVTLVRRATPEGESNLVVVLGTNRDRAGGAWARIRLAILPNGTTGWVPRASLGEAHVVRTQLVVDRTRLTAVLYRRGRVVFRAPVGVGTPSWPTPRGTFYVRQRLEDFGDPFYGPVAFGLSARSAVLTDWPGGGYVGIHGTNRPDLLPGRVSHGCIRLRNADVLRLAALMPLGTPVLVR